MGEETEKIKKEEEVISRCREEDDSEGRKKNGAEGTKKRKEKEAKKIKGESFGRKYKIKKKRRRFWLIFWL